MPPECVKRVPNPITFLGDRVTLFTLFYFFLLFFTLFSLKEVTALINVNTDNRKQKTGNVKHDTQKQRTGNRKHGIGKLFHDNPSILHYGKEGEGLTIREGMFFTIEPMINVGESHVKILNDGWTAVTRDRTLSAQFEHTLAVTKNGYEIFTVSPMNFNSPPYQL